jgi:hypothetical protein
MSIETLALAAVLAVAALLGWTSHVRARAHQQWARRRHTVDTLFVLPTADWWVSLEVAAGWL